MANTHVYIITGNQGEGKSSLLKEVVTGLRQAGVKPGGFIAEGMWDDGRRSGFLLKQIGTHESVPLCVANPTDGYFQLKRFWFNPRAIEKGIAILNSTRTDNAEVVVIDEIGVFELEGKVWHDAFVQLLKAERTCFLITVRNSIKEAVIKKFSLTDYTFYTAGDNPVKLVEDIRNNVQNRRC